MRKKKGWTTISCKVCGKKKYMAKSRVTCGKLCAKKLRNHSERYYVRKKK